VQSTRMHEREKVLMLQNQGPFMQLGML